MVYSGVGNTKVAVMGRPRGKTPGHRFSVTLLPEVYSLLIAMAKGEDRPLAWVISDAIKKRHDDAAKDVQLDLGLRRSPQSQKDVKMSEHSKSQETEVADLIAELTTRFGAESPISKDVAASFARHLHEHTKLSQSQILEKLRDLKQDKHQV